jgi:hypothetical protein
MVAEGDDDDITGIKVVFVSMLTETDQAELPALPLTSTNTTTKALTKNIEFYLPLHNGLGVYLLHCTQDCTSDQWHVKDHNFAQCGLRYLLLQISVTQFIHIFKFILTNFTSLQ